jgi:hypothetical protein
MNQYNNWSIEPNICNISTSKKRDEEKRYLKSEDKIVIVNESKEKIMILHSHNIKFTLDNSLYQEVFCHDNRIHSKDEVSYKKKIIYIYINKKIFNFVTNLFFFFFILFL